MALGSGTQLTLDYEGGLTERHGSLLGCIREGAYTHRNPLKTLAADMDISQSELSRKLAGNPEDPRRFSVDDLERYLVASGDLTPIYYLIEKFLQDEEMRQRRALNQLAKQMPAILALVRAATKEEA